MWSRVRVDIAWGNLIGGFVGALLSDDVVAAQEGLEAGWSAGRGDALAALSVRSGFDLLLQALPLSPGDEVLMSAVTIPAMPAIAAAHGLVPVPVGVVGSDFRVDLAALRRAVTPRSRVLVVAHLFGARPQMGEVCAVAREHGLFVVEDCAQAWCGTAWRGTPEADASLFSFGTIKTATAAGGALCRIRDAELLARMRSIQSRQPVQTRREFLMKLLKCGALKGLSARPVYGLLAAWARRHGRRIDDVLGPLARGFPGPARLEPLRRRPCTGLLRLMARRLGTYDPRRIEARIETARRYVEWLGLQETQPELLATSHSFWLFPLVDDRPEERIAEFAARGIDAAQRGRLEVIPPPPGRPELACPSATDLLRRTVLLPCYGGVPVPVPERRREVARDALISR